MKAPCALVGAKLPGIEIKQAKVRGIASFGMMCSEKELGLAEESAGLMVLAADAVVGQSIREHLDLDDHLITLKLTPNRSDCLSLNGIAREVAALTGAPLQAVPQTSFKQAASQSRKIKVTASVACPRYTGRVISGVNAKAATPAWMVQRLERCGLRSISALVDVTNYVLLELGQPLHAFDLNKLNGDIEVRFARAGESLKLLNEQTVNLKDDMLVIADGKTPVALGWRDGRRGKRSGRCDHRHFPGKRVLRAQRDRRQVAPARFQFRFFLPFRARRRFFGHCRLRWIAPHN